MSATHDPAEVERVATHPKDECECGDYRSDHPNDGPCRFNAPGFDVCHAASDCTGFRISRAHILERKSHDE